MNSLSVLPWWGSTTSQQPAAFKSHFAHHGDISCSISLFLLFSRTNLNRSPRSSDDRKISKFRESTPITREADGRRWFSTTRRCPCRTRSSTWSPLDCRGCPRQLSRGDSRSQVGSMVAGAATTASGRRHERDRRCRPPWGPRDATCSDSSPLPSPPDPASTAEKHPTSCKTSHPRAQTRTRSDLDPDGMRDVTGEVRVRWVFPDCEIWYESRNGYAGNPLSK